MPKITQLSDTDSSLEEKTFNKHRGRRTLHKSDNSETSSGEEKFSKKELDSRQAIKESRRDDDQDIGTALNDYSEVAREMEVVDDASLFPTIDQSMEIGSDRELNPEFVTNFNLKKCWIFFLDYS